MFGELKVRLSSIQKRSIVHRTVQSVFGELTVRPIKNGLKKVNDSVICCTCFSKNKEGKCGILYIYMYVYRRNHRREF